MENEQTIKQESANTAPQAVATAPKPAQPAAAPAETKPAENELQLRCLAPEDLRAEMQRLKDEEHFDFLETLTGMDWGEEGLGVVYTLWSTTKNKRVSLKTATTDRESPFLPTVSDLWDIANIYEREVFDFFGIKFLGHPDMRRIFLREDWTGYPMRKDDKPEEENPLRMDNEPLADVTTQYNRQPDGSITTQENTIFTEDDYVVNIGPQHPSTHGVLHFRVALEGERIRKIDPILGYIHRGIEKLNESLTYPQALALTERLDYLGAMQNRHALCMCIEKAAGIEVSERVQYIRTIMDEFQRIDSHILFFSCLCQDMGATSAFLYGFRDREQILDIFEETCGGRLILNYNTIGGVMADIHPNFVRRVKEFIPYMRHNLQEYYDIFVNNVIARNRLEGVGVLNKEQVISFGCTGGTGRAAGWSNDLRKHQPYAAYDKVDFKEITYTEGDSFARLMVRMKEIEESLNIIEQLIDGIPEGPFQTKTKPIIKIPAGTYYSAVEGSRGEFGVLLESKGDKFPSRLHYRSTGLPLVAAMDTVCHNCFIADLMAIGGTVDYVVPDIDR
jgi:NADH dehydrogenase I, C/D subunit